VPHFGYDLGMYSLHLTDDQMHELESLTQQQGLAPRTRNRLEMVRLSNCGWSVPKIAEYLNVYDKTVRYWVKAFLAGGFDALPDQPHLGQKSAIGPDIIEQVQQWTEQDNRTYSASQIAQKVDDQFGIRRSACQWTRLLRQSGFSCKRTHRTLHHNQNPEEVAWKRADLETLEKGGL